MILYLLLVVVVESRTNGERLVVDGELILLWRREAEDHESFVTDDARR